MVEEAIYSLLQFHTRVNIPEFGAVLKKPDFSQALFFNQFLKFDDGLLMNHLTRVVGCSQNEAEAEIFAFIMRVTKQLEDGNIYYAKEVGYFCTLEERIELYARQEDIPFSIRSAQMTIVSGEGEMLPQQQAPVTQQERTRSDEEEAVPDEHSLLVEEEYPEMEDEHELIELGESDDNNFESEREEKLPDENGPIIFGWRVEPKLTGIAAVLLVLVIAAVAITVISVWGDGTTIQEIDREDVLLSQLTKETAEDLEELSGIIDDTSSTSGNPAEERDQDLEPIADPGTAANEVDDTHTENEEERAIQGGEYHIIIGVFRDETYADRMVEDCRKLGIQAHKLDKWNDLFRVSYAKFGSLAEAKEEHEKVKQRYEEAWLMKRDP